MILNFILNVIKVYKLEYTFVSVQTLFGGKNEYYLI